MAKRASRKTIQKRAQEHFTALDEGIIRYRHDKPVLAQRYIDLARRISRKLRIPLPRSIKRQHCKHCKTLLISGKNSRNRLKKGKMTVYCENCKKYTRFVYK